MGLRRGSGIELGWKRLITMRWARMSLGLDLRRLAKIGLSGSDRMVMGVEQD